MVRYKVDISGTKRANTSENKNIVVVKGDSVVLVKDLGEKALVKYENDKSFVIPLGCFEMYKSELILA